MIYRPNKNRFLSIAKASRNDGDSIIANITPIVFKTASINFQNSWNVNYFKTKRTSIYIINGCVTNVFSEFILDLYIDDSQFLSISNDEIVDTKTFYFKGTIEAGSLLEIRSSENITLYDSDFHYIEVNEVTKCI